MKQYCAFLRGINVNGTTMKMKDVCHLFSNVGVSNVQSVLASGNIIFESDKSAEFLKETLEITLSENYKYNAHVFVLSIPEVVDLFNNKAFQNKEGHHHYVLISDPKTSEELQRYFDEVADKKIESGRIVNGYFYWQTPKGSTLTSAFSKILSKKSFKDQLTSRNLNTIEKILNKK